MATYEEEVYKNFGHNLIVKEVMQKYYGTSLEYLWQKIEEYEIDHTSYELFNGSVLLMYPKISEQVSRKRRICDFSGAEIRPGSSYIKYSALIVEAYGNNKFIISPDLNVECGYENYLPRSISDLDEMELNIKLGEYKEGIYYDILKKKYDGLPLKRVRSK